MQSKPDAQKNSWMTRSLFIRGSFVLVASSSITACATMGNKFDPNDVDKLQPGVSTIEDARKLLGPHNAESSFAGGGRLLQWQFSQVFLTSGVGAHVAILFDSKDRMVRVTHKQKTTMY